MSFSAPRLLDAGDFTQTFESGKPALDEWFRRYALLAGAAGTAKTFVTCTQDGQVAGFYSLATGQVLHQEATDRVVRGVGQHAVPVIVLARLAVDTRFQGMGLGAGLLKDCASRVVNLKDEVGFRALFTHAKDAESAAFYSKFGFEVSPIDELQMMILIKDLRKLF